MRLSDFAGSNLFPVKSLSCKDFKEKIFNYFEFKLDGKVRVNALSKEIANMLEDNFILRQNRFGITFISEKRS